MVANNRQTEIPYDPDAKIGDLLASARAGHEVALTRNGHVVARIVREVAASSPTERQRIFQRLNELAQQSTLGGLNLKDMITEGRR
jgi:antitoxin (DNA-binding transcriptional repressor) of toxin-antitoxin stability system